MATRVYIPTNRPDGKWDHIIVPVEKCAAEYNTEQLGALGLCVGSRTSTLSCLAGWEFNVEQIPYPFACCHPNYLWFKVTTLVQEI
jgi:hypothetical protein